MKKQPATVRIKITGSRPKRQPIPLFSLVGVNVAKLRAFCMEECDGWTIFGLTPLRKMGMSEGSIAVVAQKHESDRKNPKGTIFGKNGKVIDMLYGVYGLDFIQRVSRELTGQGSVSAMGRGFRCQQFQQLLKPVFDTLIADGVESIAPEHIKP